MRKCNLDVVIIARNKRFWFNDIPFSAIYLFLIVDSLLFLRLLIIKELSQPFLEYQVLLYYTASRRTLSM